MICFNELTIYNILINILVVSRCIIYILHIHAHDFDASCFVVSPWSFMVYWSDAFTMYQNVSWMFRWNMFNHMVAPEPPKQPLKLWVTSTNNKLQQPKKMWAVCLFLRTTTTLTKRELCAYYWWRVTYIVIISIVINNWQEYLRCIESHH